MDFLWEVSQGLEITSKPTSSDRFQTLLAEVQGEDDETIGDLDFFVFSTSLQWGLAFSQGRELQDTPSHHHVIGYFRAYSHV